MMKIFLLSALCGGMLFSCSQVNETAVPDKPEPEKESEKDQLLRTGSEILVLLKEHNYARLSDYIDPHKGLLFSPYAYIDTTHNLILSSGELVETARKDRKLFWGMHDGSGDSINLTLREYGKAFIYTDHFLDAKLVQINKSAAKGNMINNIAAVFGDCSWIEYYFPGHEAKYEGMDWSALRLVFQKNGEKLYLVAIIHDQWTV